MSDQHHAGSALRGIGLGPSMDAAPMPASLLENAIYRLDRIANILGDGNKNLTDLRSRAFGPWPEAGQTGNLREASPTSQQARVSNMLDRLEAAARTSLEHAVSLNSSL